MGTAFFLHNLDIIVLFSVTVAASIYLDLFVHRRGEEISFRSAALWSLFWVCLSLCFAGYLAVTRSSAMAGLFLSGWVLEKSLSLDNLMVFVAIFRAFGVRSALQHRILYYGILGALVFRLVFVALGGAALHLFGLWADLVFAGFVGYAAVQMIRGDGADEAEPDYDALLPVRVFKRLFPLYPRLDGRSFFISRARVDALMRNDPSLKPSHAAATRFMTPALVCLVVIEWSDVMFSFDSVPVVIAVTKEPLLIYSAMVFAILGLRSLYFVIEAMSRTLVHLEKAVAVLLFFVTYKLLAHALRGFFHWPLWEPTPEQGSVIIGGILLLGVVASLVSSRKHPTDPQTPETTGGDATE
jgi:tellurite resistance protein TerC